MYNKFTSTNWPIQIGHKAHGFKSIWLYWIQFLSRILEHRGHTFIHETLQFVKGILCNLHIELNCVKLKSITIPLMYNAGYVHIGYYCTSYKLFKMNWPIVKTVKLAAGDHPKHWKTVVFHRCQFPLRVQKQ